MITTTLLAVALGQTGFSLKSKDGSLTVSAGPGSIQRLADEKFLLTLSAGSSPVVIRSKTQGLELTGQTVECRAERTSKKIDTLVVRNAKLTGSVKITRNSSADWSAKITAATALFRAPGPIGTVDLKGATRIEQKSPADRQQMTVTGSGGWVSFAMDGKGGQRGLLSGVINGPVDLTVVQSPLEAGGMPSIVRASGRQVLLEARTAPMTLTMIGVKSVEGLLGEGRAELSGAQRMIVTLDSDGRASKIELKGDKS